MPDEDVELDLAWAVDAAAVFLFYYWDSRLFWPEPDRVPDCGRFIPW